MGVDVMLFLAPKDANQALATGREAHGSETETLSKPPLPDVLSRFIRPVEPSLWMSELSEREIERWHNWPVVEDHIRAVLAELDGTQDAWYTMDNFNWEDLEHAMVTGDAFRCDEEFLTQMRATYESIRSLRND